MSDVQYNNLLVVQNVHNTVRARSDTIHRQPPWRGILEPSCPTAPEIIRKFVLLPLSKPSGGSEVLLFAVLLMQLLYMLNQMNHFALAT